MESEAGRPVLINQLALEEQIPAEQIESFRKSQRRRGVQLISDVQAEAQIPQLEAEKGETEAHRKGKEERECAQTQDRIRDQIARVKNADPSSEEFWEGRISLLFGRDFQGRPVSGRVEWELESTEEKKVEEKKETQRGTHYFWKEHQ
jgi:hypothetical protein